MASMALSSVERVFKAGLAIKKAVKTVKQNKKEYRDIERSVARVGTLLSLLNETTEIFNHPAMRGPLDDLAESLEEALQLIKDCEGRHPVCRLFGAGGMARELGRVHDDILRKLTLGNFAITVHVTITLTRTVQYGVAHGPHLQLQDAGSTYSDHLTTDDARSGINSEITMVTTASEVPCDPSSRLTEFNLSKSEATMHHISEENISVGGNHSFVLKQKIVIKIDITSERSRIKAMALVAKTEGVSSMGITERNTLEVIGHGIDPVWLVKCLRKNMFAAQILQAEDLRDQEAQPVEVNTEEASPGPADKMTNRRRPGRIGDGIRAVLTKLSTKFMWPRTPRSISLPPPSSPLRIEHMDTPAPTGSCSHDNSDVSSLSTAVISAASPPVSSSARLSPLRQPEGATSDEQLPTVESGCVLEDYVAMFDGPLPPAVIAAVTETLFYSEDEGAQHHRALYSADAVMNNEGT